MKIDAMKPPKTGDKKTCGQKILKFITKTLKKPMVMHGLLWIGVVLYVGLGAAIMVAVEGPSASENVSADYELTAPQSSWNMQNSIRFIFGVITTCGTGGVMPETDLGVIVAVFIALPGIPFAILVVADIGKFLMDSLVYAVEEALKYIREKKRIRDKLRGDNDEASAKNVSENSFSTLDTEELQKMAEKVNEEYNDDDDIESSYVRPTLQIGFFFVFSFLTMFLPVFPDSRSVLDKLFRSFLMITSMGFGEAVPCEAGICVKRVALMMVYATMGIILMTMSIEAAAEGFRKIHYLGAKLADIGKSPVWFGGKRVNINKIMRPIAEKYNIPLDELNGLIMLTAQGLDWRTSFYPPDKPILESDVRRVFGADPDDISFAHADSISNSTIPTESDPGPPPPIPVFTNPTIPDIDAESNTSNPPPS